VEAFMPGSWGLVKPPGLVPGDRVAVVAPAGPVDRESLEAGLRVLAERYETTWEPDLLRRSRYLAGDDARRADELRAALADGRTKAVIAARGGYGSMRLLPRLWPADAREGSSATPGGGAKLVVGFSDITALHCALQARGQVSIHGPSVNQLATQPPAIVERLFGLLEDPASPPAEIAGTPLVGGTAEGRILGGNLSLLTRLLGTPWLPDLDGAILLLEDVTEQPYRVDRMWTHLRLAGTFERVAGIALGDFTDCEDPAGGYTLRDVLAGLAGETGLPSVVGLPIGHAAVNAPVALGTRARLDGSAGTLTFLEPAVGVAGSDARRAGQDRAGLAV
jgi:muramoyltetrapeptide carboxypeptidase